MSGITSIVPKGLIKNSVVGACVAVCFYVVLQLISALLVHCEIADENAVYPMVCCTAALSSLAGCSYSALRGGKGSALSVSAVVLIFLSLTLIIGLSAGNSEAVAEGMVWIGAAMSAGGLVAALLVNLIRRKKNVGRKKMKRGRKVK